MTNAANKNKKTFILDTSVLLYDRCSIHSFDNNDVVIPLVVLDEIDRFKEKSGLLGENARYINRFLDGLRSQGSLYKGVRLENNQGVRVEPVFEPSIPAILDKTCGDNKIIGAALHLKEKIDNVVVVTKDINFRVKCDALGLPAEDYYKDKIVNNSSEIYTGQKIISISDVELFEEFYNKGTLPLSKLDENLYPNQFVIGKMGNQSLLGVVKNNKLHSLTCELDDLIKINARNKEQKFALDLLTRDDIPIVTLTGIAGSGKTFLTLMSALSGLNEGRYERIVVTRSLQPVGREIGFLPGNIKDKMDPWVSPIVDNFRHAFKDVNYFELMQEKGKVEVAPLAFIRGRTFNNSFIIMDESQNATIHELKTIITRVGEGSKIVLLGDIEQIDTPYIDSLSNGLTIIVEKFKKEELSGHVTLIKGERSKLATLASKVI